MHSFAHQVSEAKSTIHLFRLIVIVEGFDRCLAFLSVPHFPRILYNSTWLPEVSGCGDWKVMELVNPKSLPSFHNPFLFAKCRISGQISQLGLRAKIYTLCFSEASVCFMEFSLSILHPPFSIFSAYFSSFLSVEGLVLCKVIGRSPG